MIARGTYKRPTWATGLVRVGFTRAEDRIAGLEARIGRRSYWFAKLPKPRQ